MSARVQWMSANAAMVFDPAGDKGIQNEVDQCLRDNTKMVDSFLSGAAKKSHLFVYYQKPDVVLETGEYVDGPGRAKVILTYGDKERLKGRAAYFVRTCAEDKAIKDDVATDPDLLYGEISGAPLASLNAGLTNYFVPLINKTTGTSFGQCPTEQKTEFVKMLGKFNEELGDAVRSMAGGIELKPLDPEKDVSAKRVDYTQLATNQPDLVQYYEELLGEWCEQVESFLEGNQANEENETPGPRTELEIWRARMQRITSITERLKGKDFKTVFAVLHAASRVPNESAQRANVVAVLRRWKRIDVSITESFNEAKDNVKYLGSLDKFLEPLYTGTPQSIVDNIPALLNGVKMIHTIARYYNTTERMTNLLTKVTNQMILNCKMCILGDDEDASSDQLWERNPTELIRNLELCLKMNECYQEEYRKTKEKLMALPKGKQFDFSETLIFGRFDLFCRRVVKLIDMFSTIYQFQSLSQHRFDGMEVLVDNFKYIMDDFRNKRHDLLDFHHNRFDRDYVDFNVRISDLEAALQQFINQSFESITSITSSLNLLKKFQSILQRETLRSDLESKFTVIFHNYGLELTTVQDQYEKHKAAPPLVRNLPPVAGNITWARHLLKRIEGPMQKFQRSPSVLAGKDAKKIIRMYNKMAKTLVEFETLWYQAWVHSIEQAKSGLQSTLIVRHPDDGKLHVNFDWEILQLIRETKCLDRMGIEIPESAKMVLLQEAKFKGYYNELSFVLREYRRVVQTVKPIASNLLKPHLDNLEFQLRPGRVTLTWTSMNITNYIDTVWRELRKLEQLVLTVNDIMENRVDASLKAVARLLLVSLPEESETVSLDDFIDIQEKHVREITTFLHAKSLEIEDSVDDLLVQIVGFPIDSHVRGVSESEIIKVKAHYNWSMYQALLNATRRSLNAIKTRLTAKRDSGKISIAASVEDKEGKEDEEGGASATPMSPPFFDVDLELDGVGVRLKPTIEDIQSAVNGGAVAVLKCSKMIDAWDTVTIPEAVQLIINPNLPPIKGSAAQGTFYDRISQDKEILKVVLLLSGSIQSARRECDNYVQTFDKFNMLWMKNVEDEYKEFQDSIPTLSDFESKVKSFIRMAEDAARYSGKAQISALVLKSDGLSKSLVELAQMWKMAFAKKLHIEARGKLDSVSEMVKQTSKKLNREVGDGDIDALGFVMQTLQEVRAKQSEIELEFGPITHMYQILDAYTPQLIDKDEQDMRSMLRTSWDKLLQDSEARQDVLSAQQAQHKKTLITTVNNFKKDVQDFRKNYEANGPMVDGIPPKQAVERLKRFREEYQIRERKQQIYFLGEDLFGLPHQQYPKLDKTKGELEYLGQLYDLYVVVLDTIKEWKDYLWAETPDHVEVMQSETEKFAGRCKRMPKVLREWPAYLELKKEIDDFSEVLPLLTELAKPSIMPRHWKQVMDLTGKELPIESDTFKLQNLIDAKLNEFTDEVSDICESADKQLIIEKKLAEISEQWSGMNFDFTTWKSRDYPCCMAPGRVGEVQEILEETVMALNTMNAQRHSIPFKEELGTMIMTLSDTADTIERWFKVQQMWTSLESVFTGGDIAKQMPMEAKKFQQIDKDWIRIMGKSAEMRNVVNCCQNDMLKQLLPVLQVGLEQCQKSLESYLEGKRNKFPRFYFTSDPALLKILSQGSDPEAIQEDFEKLFDSISRVTFDAKDRRKMTQCLSLVGTGAEYVNFVTPQQAVGNIEDWLNVLEAEVARSVRRECKIACGETGNILNGVSVKDFAEKYIAQVALLGIQVVWTVDFEDALIKMSKEKDKTIMALTNKKFVQIMQDLVGACLMDLGSKMNRTKFETLVTVHVHQKDLFQEVWQKVKAHKVKDENDFEWLRQTRLYWKSDIEHCIISIADVDFTYSYEYLGCKERLCITALTDRCYVTLSQALGMFLGGAPAGPAGTGKTETTKDMGRTLGIFVMVTNCSDQLRFRDCGKIFKGLCMSGIWGCFDEFNRIEVEVLSVVAMQVEAITQGKRQNAKMMPFPGEVAPIRLIPSVGYFITMNPGYAGRQELPENLKVQFRGVCMMVPNRETIMKVKLASVGYSMMDVLGKKFFVLYGLCEQQLSKQRHYDFGLRNILSVLRTSGIVKRAEPPDMDEEMLFMRTARDMNLSKFVADDVPLFLALLKDLFPKTADPPKKTYPEIDGGARKIAKAKKLTEWDTWMLKIIQLYETSLVRHGFMLVGPTACGKTEIMMTLVGTLNDNGLPHRTAIMNPKAITDSQMYGVKDPVSEEWTPGVFASIWARYNNRNLKYTTWIVCDGPVDAIWIENLNTVLDDNKILTLANNDRFPMTDNCKIVFEVENLRNASPATVSRAGIIFISPSDLGWKPVLTSWLAKRTEINANRFDEAEHIRDIFNKLVYTPPPGTGICEDLFDYFNRNIETVMPLNDSLVILNTLNMLSALLHTAVQANEVLPKEAYMRLCFFCIVWGFTGLCEPEERVKFYEKFCESVNVAKLKDCIPPCKEGQTLFDYVPDMEQKHRPYIEWKPEEWKPPKKLIFSSLLIPTLDSTRAEYLMGVIQNYQRVRLPAVYRSSLLCGGAGTAKTSTCLMYMARFNVETMLAKRINFSSATTPLGFQKTVEAEVERKTGKTFCPPGGKEMTLFLDDISMPVVNKWGDQVTNELTRQLIEMEGFYFLDKDKRGDFKTIEALSFLGAMGHPGGGRNDVPSRLKSKFYCFNMVAPATVSVDNIYGSILRARFTNKNGFKDEPIGQSKKLTSVTIDVWNKIKNSLLPTPARFHYIFNMRELSRVFQGILEAPSESLKTADLVSSLWKHETTRVFADKLSRQVDKEFVSRTVTDYMNQHFGEDATERVAEMQDWWCDFQREGGEDPETGEEVPAPKVYEPMQSMEFVRMKAYEYLKRFNETFPAAAMNLVLFDDAMRYMMRINRTIQFPRGSAMLVGVGGSGKQSLTRLSASTSRQKCFQITITKTYNDNALFEDLRGLYVAAGAKGEKVTFVFTDAEVKNEGFLEYLNSILATGEVVGLFQKDERDGMAAECRNDFVRDYPGAEETMANFYRYFMDRLRDNLHLVLCFSPMNEKFPVRAQKFPALFSAVAITWFLPWPAEALVAVASAFLGPYEIDTPKDKKQLLYELLGSMQAMVGEVCGEYFTRMRKHVYVTPKTFLCLIDFYKGLYRVKYDNVNEQEKAVNTGLEKLAEASAQVEEMKIELREQEKVLKIEEEKTNKLLTKVQYEKGKAEKKAEEVGVQKAGCLETAATIQKDKEEANIELQKAMPFLHEAEAACKSITPKDITELKTNKNPTDVIKLTFDGLAILMIQAVIPPAKKTFNISKVDADFIADSFQEYTKFTLSDMRFLPSLLDFAANEKDNMNDETCELLEPYLRYNADPAKNWSPWAQFPVLDPAIAKKASGAAEGLCKFVGAMVQYHGAAKIVKPKMDFLKVQEAKLDKAMKELGAAEAELARVMSEVAELDKALNEALEKKAALEANANAMKRKMNAANALLSGLAGENARWTEDSKNFALRRKALVGDIALCCAFVTYCGPFNSEFREKLNIDYFLADTHRRGVPASQKVNLVESLVEGAVVAEWALEGLPSDDLSVQNGIMVTRSSRYPLMVDPQGQANRWIKSREAERIAASNGMAITTLNNSRLKDFIEFTMGEGLVMLIENVENELDPMLDPLLDKAIIKKGKNLYINISDQNMDYNPKFYLFMTSRLPNPHFSPELSAKCTVIDFTVTLKGLEQQLLGRVLGMEQKSLEESLAQLKEEVTNNLKALALLNDQLLFKLSNSTGSLLDDTELIEVLANTKAKATEVSEKLATAAEKEIDINEKREQFRSVATRGSLMYFNMTDMTLVMNPITLQPTGWMYNCSLIQFLEQFDKSITNSEKVQPTSKRVDKIIDYLTYQVYRYMNRGLFERDKMTFKLMVTLKVLTVAGDITGADVSCFLKAGSALDVKSERPCPFRWLSDKIWLNLLNLSRHPFGSGVIFYREIVDNISKNEAAWKRWFDENEPEGCPVPDYEERLTMERALGPIMRMVLVRSMREDRTTVACAQFVNAHLGARFTAPVTDPVSDIFDESACRKPVLYLLTTGSDPSASIDELAKKKKKFPTDKVSMGEGQEVVAWEKMKNGFLIGSWVILQNCHLGIGFMNQQEDILTKTPEIHEDFRLWLTVEITRAFPIGLLQMSIKVTAEPPAGLKAGLFRTYTTIMSQEALEKIDHEKWRQITFVQSFLHSVVQERRKFGPIGWCVPYEYNNSDLEACLMFLEKHLSTTITVGQPLSWVTIQYMVAEVQYGGRITDDLDRELFITYTEKWMNEDMFKPGFLFNNYASEFNYKLPSGLEIQDYRDYIDTMPPVDSPMIFGLHTNADLTYRLKEAAEMLQSIMETQPKDSGGGAGKSMDEIVKDIANDYKAKCPPDFVEEVFRAQIAKLKGPPNTPDKGFGAPLNIFLFQELQRLQNIIAIVRSNLENLVMAIDGTVVMTPELLQDLNSVFDAKVPGRWTHDPSGAEISWLSPSIGTWYTGLVERHSLLYNWLENGRGFMKSYWLTGFTNAQGFLTGVRQEVTRQHKKDQWALDDVMNHTEVQTYDPEKAKDVPEEGQHFHGLFMEGSRWNRQEGKIDESEPKKLFTNMPVIYLTAVTIKEKKALAGMYGSVTPYNCAVYKYPKRNDRYLIFRLLLKTDIHASHWKLRGTCLLAQTE
ncbi:unnamed protein product [Amoebophrya sp. A120]|nr:unnamed protein product [Amoebophrya sp. A120]|eukprot:GSA120T00016605001.1